MIIIDRIKLNLKINTLQNEIDTLQETIKEDLLSKFMSKLNDEAELNRLRNENKRLRAKVKSLKEIIKEN